RARPSLVSVVTCACARRSPAPPSVRVWLSLVPRATWWRRSWTTPWARPSPPRRPSRPTCVRSTATRRPRPARSASSSPSVPRLSASTPSCSTAAATSTTVVSLQWPTAPARVVWPCDDLRTEEEDSLMAAGQRSGAPQGAATENKDRNDRRGGGRRDDRRGGREEKSAFLEKVVTINRVAKVVKGGRRFSFTALVVVGDGDGTVGVGYGKAKEVPAAIAKGVEEAKKNFFRVPRIQGTIPHPIQGEAAAGVVFLRPAS